MRWARESPALDVSAPVIGSPAVFDLAESRPIWLALGDDIAPKLIVAAERAIRRRFERHPDPNIGVVPYAAFSHFVNSLKAADRSNREGHHGVAVSLLRQCLEAIALVATGLSVDAASSVVVADWNQGRISHGLIRKHLDDHVWPRFGSGLWDETWTDFFSNLARSVQPYAHYSPELAGWQWHDDQHSLADNRMNAYIGPSTYDAIKASRVTLLQTLLFWTLGRVASQLENDPELSELWPSLERLRMAIGRSRMLFREGNWGDQLLPTMLFSIPDGWRDD